MKLLVFIGILALAFWGLVTGIEQLLGTDDLAGCSEPSLVDPNCAAADAIVAISGGDTSSRVSEAVRMYKTGWAPKLVFSGAALDPNGPSNAEAMQRQAVATGVPESAILIDTKAIDTTENAFNTSALVAGADRIIVVTSQYHQRRAALEFEHFLGEAVTVVSHPTPHDRLWPEYWWTSWPGWSLALTEAGKTLFVMVIPR